MPLITSLAQLNARINAALAPIEQDLSSSAHLPPPDAAGAPCLPSAPAASRPRRADAHPGGGSMSAWAYATDLASGRTFASSMADPEHFGQILERAADFYGVEQTRVGYVDTY